MLIKYSLKFLASYSAKKSFFNTQSNTKFEEEKKLLKKLDSITSFLFNPEGRRRLIKMLHFSGHFFQLYRLTAYYVCT